VGDPLPTVPAREWLRGEVLPRVRRASGSRFGMPEAYTPKHLAEKISPPGAHGGGAHDRYSPVRRRSGFTAISERLDPKEVHAIMDRA